MYCAFFTSAYGDAAVNRLAFRVVAALLYWLRFTQKNVSWNRKISSLHANQLLQEKYRKKRNP